MDVSLILRDDKTIRRGVAAVQAGANVSIVGRRLSGRSTLLGQLAAELREAGYRPITISASTGLRPFPLAQLQKDLAGEASVQRQYTFAVAFSQLRKLLSQGSAVIMVDDVEDLDDGSWGVIQAVSKSDAVPLVTTRKPGLSLATNLDGGGFSVEMEVQPVSFEGLESLLSRRLGGPLVLDTVSRIYTKAGGLTGLACAIADAGVLSETIRRNQQDVWAAGRTLWTPLLRPTAEAYLTGLVGADRVALEMIALAGLVPLSTLDQIADEDALLHLEDCGLLRVEQIGGQQLVSIFPPLVAEALKNDHRAIHHSKRAGSLIESLGEGSAEAALVAAEPSPESQSDQNALDARVFRERLRARLVAAKVRWSARAGTVNAVSYVSAVLQGGTDRSEIDEIIAATDFDDGSPAEQINLLTTGASWVALGRGDLEEALDLLAVNRPAADGFERLLDAARVRLRTLCEGVPDDFATALEIEDTLPEEVQDSLLEARGLVLLTLARVSDARDALAAVSKGRMSNPLSQANRLFGYLLLAEGEFESSRQWAEAGMSAAFRECDADSFFDHGYLLVLQAVFEGNYESAEETLARLFAVGEPSPLVVHTHLALRELGTIVAVRRGKPGVAQRLLQGIDELGVSRGPLLGQSKAVATAQIKAFNGDTRAAIEGLWREGEYNWQCGYRYVAAQQLLMSYEMEGGPERTQQLNRLMEDIEGDFLNSFFHYLMAREAKDAEALVALVPLLVSTGRPGHAVNALDFAEEIALKNHQHDLERTVHDTREALLKELDERPIDTRRFLTFAVTLTSRENEIATLIAEGMANPEIAAKLVVSPRTIESHINRILRKTRAADRAELIEFMKRG